MRKHLAEVKFNCMAGFKASFCPIGHFPLAEG